MLLFNAKGVTYLGRLWMRGQPATVLAQVRAVLTIVRCTVVRLWCPGLILATVSHSQVA